MSPDTDAPDPKIYLYRVTVRNPHHWEAKKQIRRFWPKRSSVRVRQVIRDLVRHARDNTPLLFHAKCETREDVEDACALAWAGDPGAKIHCQGLPLTRKDRRAIQARLRRRSKRESISKGK